MKHLSKEEMMNVNAGATYTSAKCRYCGTQNYTSTYYSWVPNGLPFSYAYAKVVADGQLYNHEIDCIEAYL